MRSRISRVLVWVIAGFACSTPPADELPLHFVTEPFPPYTYAVKDKAAGPMVDVLRAVCEQLKRSCTIEVLPWRRALSLAERGAADGIFTVLDTPERRAFFHISLPVIDARYTLFAQAGADFRFDGDRQVLKGRTIGVYGPSGSSYVLEQLVEGMPDVSRVLEYDNATVLRKLAAGRYGPQGLVLINEAVGLDLIRTERLSGLQAAGTVKQFSYSFGLTRARLTTADARQFDAALAALCSSGRTAALLKPYGLPATACKHA